jgi:hypothetical protein
MSSAHSLHTLAQLYQCLNEPLSSITHVFRAVSKIPAKDVEILRQRYGRRGKRYLSTRGKMRETVSRDRRWGRILSRRSPFCRNDVRPSAHCHTPPSPSHTQAAARSPPGVCCGVPASAPPRVCVHCLRGKTCFATSILVRHCIVEPSSHCCPGVSILAHAEAGT